MKDSNHIYPLFPLEFFSYPGKRFQLHIFEEQDIQLVKDTMKEDRCFLIPYVIRGEKQALGSFVRILEIESTDIKDEFDITLTVEEIFKTERVFDKQSGKLYRMAQVEFLEFEDKFPCIKLLALYNEFVGLQGKHQGIVFSQYSINLFALVENLDLTHHQKFTFIKEGNTMAFETNIINYLILQNAIEKSLKKVGLKFVLN